MEWKIPKYVKKTNSACMQAAKKKGKKTFQNFNIIVFTNKIVTLDENDLVKFIRNKHEMNFIPNKHEL